MRHYPPPPPVLLEAGLLPQVGEDGPPSVVVGIVGPDEVGAGLGEVAEGTDAAAAHGVEEAKAAAGGAAVEGGGQHAEVPAGGALRAEEGVAGVELDASLRVEGRGDQRPGRRRRRRRRRRRTVEEREQAHGGRQKMRE